MNDHNNKRSLWIERIKNYKESGLTAAKWCEDNDIGIYTLRYWIHKLNKEKKMENIPSKLVPVTLSQSSAVDSCPIKVTIGSSTVEVLPGFDIGAFQTVVRILSQEC